jgi:hypothetical protein
MTIWVLLGIIVLALLAFFAFGNRDAEEASDTPSATSALTEDAMARDAARAEAATELTVLRARAEAGETYETLADEFSEVRANLAAAYANAEGEAAEEWTELQADFDAFEASARAGTSNFLDSITSLIDRFSADVRVEAEGE